MDLKIDPRTIYLHTMNIITSLWLSTHRSAPNAEVRLPWPPQGFNSTIWENMVTHLPSYLPCLCFLLITSPLADWFPPSVALLMTLSAHINFCWCLNFTYSQLALALQYVSIKTLREANKQSSCDTRVCVCGGSLTSGDTWCEPQRQWSANMKMLMEV